MSMSMKLEGFADFTAGLRELPKGTQGNVIVRSLEPAAELVREVAAATAPRLSGHLSGDVRVSRKLTKRQSKFAKKDGKSFREIYIGVTDPAGIQTEYGNANMAAQPWFRHAWDASSAPALDRIRIELGKHIKVAGDRMRKKAARLAAAGS